MGRGIEVKTRMLLIKPLILIAEHLMKHAVVFHLVAVQCGVLLFQQAAAVVCKDGTAGVLFSIGSMG